jgi:hypothetical protein
MSMSISQMMFPTEINDLIQSFLYGDKTSHHMRMMRVCAQLHMAFLLPLMRSSCTGGRRSVVARVARARETPEDWINPFAQIERWSRHT